MNQTNLDKVSRARSLPGRRGSGAAMELTHHITSVLTEAKPDNQVNRANHRAAAVMVAAAMVARLSPWVTPFSETPVGDPLPSTGETRWTSV